MNIFLGGGSMYLTVKEVSKMLRSSERYIYRLVKNGTIPAIRLNNKILINQEKLNEVLRSMKIKKEG